MSHSAAGSSTAPPTSPTGGLQNIAPLVLANPVSLYERRSQRLRALAEGNDGLADYLRFAAQIVDAQQTISQQRTSTTQPSSTLHIDWETPPLAPASLLQDNRWQEDLLALLNHLHDQVNPQARNTIERLQKFDNKQRAAAALALLNGSTALTGSDGALFIWASLSLNAMQHAARSKVIVSDEDGVARHVCPVCGSAPVASLVHPDGLRYLHCRLCETEWHVVRSLCSNCEGGRDIGYWSLEEHFPAVKAESCGDCHSYLKILYLEKDKDADAVADDLASLALDARMEDEGFARSSVNPFLFPASEG